MMLHTDVMESATRDVLRTQAVNPEFASLVTFYTGWANDGGVRMDDAELRGALTALAMLWRRAPAWGLGSKFLEMLGESGAILTKINRDRELTASEEVAILQVLEAIAEPEPEPETETGEDPSL